MVSDIRHQSTTNLVSIDLENIYKYLFTQNNLQEFRDISSMAMEYFDEKIVPDLKNKIPGYSPVRLTNGSYGYGIFTSGSGFALGIRYSDPVSPPSFPRLCSPVLNPSSDTNVSLVGGRSPRPSLVRDLTSSRTPLAGSSKKSGMYLIATLQFSY